MDAVPWSLVDGVAVFRLGPGHGLERGAELITEAILRAKESGIDKLLVDITGIEIDPPTVMQRHAVMLEWAAAGRGAVRMALVIRPEFADPQQFGTMVALNHGLAFRGFTDSAHALEWLTRRHDG